VVYLGDGVQFITGSAGELEIDMDKAAITKNITEAQRALGNLHASVSNYLNSESMEVGGQKVTADHVAEYLENQVLFIQQQLKEATASLDEEFRLFDTNAP
jgi:hypothetical protein